MRRLSNRAQQHALYGWIKWAIILVLMFSILFFDAWMNIQTRNNDYQFARLSKKIRELCTEMSAVRVEKVDQERVGRLSSLAPDMGLVTPNPNQVQPVYYDGAMEQRKARAPMAVARVQQQEPAEVTLATSLTTSATAPLPERSGNESAGLMAPAESATEALEESKLMGSLSVAGPAPL